jgi:large subunit ribosomal protein L35
MPKIKTCKAAAKRFKATGTGKLMRNKAYGRHRLISKKTKNKRNLRMPAVTDATNVKNMKKILPYM